MQYANRIQWSSCERDNAETDKCVKHRCMNDLITDLISRDLATKLGAHYQLMRQGARSTPALAHALGNADSQVRLAAAHALRGIADPAAAPALARALDDADPSVRWIVGEGLIALDAVGLKPALCVLRDTSQPSPRLRAAVQHVVLHLSEGRFKSVLQPLAQALHDCAPHESLVAKVHRAITTIDATEAASGDTGG